MVTIYALIDTRNNLPFYVGSTIVQLKERLNYHIYNRNVCNGKPQKHTIYKQALISEIIAAGYKVELMPLLRCSKKAARKCEQYIYDLLIKNGFQLFPPSPSGYKY